MKRFVFLLLVVTPMLLLGEFVLRKAFPYKLHHVNYRGEIAYEFDEDYLLRLKKNVRKSFYLSPWNDGTKINWQSNSLGFRGKELQQNPSYRIVVYGDSNIQARFSSLENTYPEQLRKYLSQAGKEVEVINAGIIGMGPDQLLLKFEKEASFLSPDLAIFNIFCDNDFGDIIRNRLFELNDYGQLQATSFERKTDSHLLLCQKKRSNFQCLFWEETRSLINRFFGEKENPNKKSDFANELHTLCLNEYTTFENSNIQQYTHFQDHYDIDFALHRNSSSAQTKIHLMSAVLDSIQKVGEKHGVKVAFQLLPSAIDITENHILSAADLRKLSPFYDPKYQTNVVEEICINKKISCLNLYDPFLQHGANELYFYQDDHWNDVGQHLAAKTMSEWLLQGTEPKSN